MIDTIRWRNNGVEMIDQRLLPAKVRYVKCVTAEDVFDAIRVMKVRGAPAIGLAGAYGVYLGVRGSRVKGLGQFRKEIKRVVKYLSGARPTARNLFWALERMSAFSENERDISVRGLKASMLAEAHAMLDEDRKICRQIGRYGGKLIKKGSNILTHCNAGALATGGYGTALGVILDAKDKIRMVYADETRPVLQGARLTAWELCRYGMPCTVICDNMAAALMADGKVDAVITGADRIAANGDTANKIGTYALAVSARYHKIPFYIAAPFSTFDLSMADGKEIPIEERSFLEVAKINGIFVTPRNKNVKVYNPAFDVTPAGLITAIVTELGVIRRPGRRKIAGVLRRG
ncbi:MAG: S-methyl-5-thioribose-1-phosphate isomerase [Candidatus Omnitrophota bacterium]